jgi:hypothetical protein
LTLLRLDSSILAGRGDRPLNPNHQKVDAFMGFRRMAIAFAKTPPLKGDRSAPEVWIFSCFDEGSFFEQGITKTSESAVLRFHESAEYITLDSFVRSL